MQDASNTSNVVHMLDSFYFRSHLVITFELLGVNLYEWIKAGGYRGVQLDVLKSFTIQILDCLILLWNSKIVHCDLKPEVCQFLEFFGYAVFNIFIIIIECTSS